jgi:hypothetical protein
MSKIRCIALSIATLASVMITTGHLWAQQPQPTRVRGTIENVESNVLLVKSREGNEVRIQVGEKTGVIGLKKIGLADIEPNAFVGVAASPQPDGSQKAISIHIFPEASRGFNEGSRAYDVRPNSSMTNGAVANRVKGADGDVLTITYKDGEKKIIVTPETSIVRFEAGELSELRQGAKIVATVVERADGAKEVVRVNVGRD